jgi:hypothetical protein
MSVNQPRHYSRQFLNNPGHQGLAAVLAEVRDGDTSDDYLDFGALFEISDCNRTVSIDFGVYGSLASQGDRDELRDILANAQAKALRLQEELNAFVAVLGEALADVETTINQHDQKG